MIHLTADRAPPHAPEAEIAVLGGMLIDGAAIAKAVELVDESMFYREGNRRVFRAMLRLFKTGAVVDPPSLYEELSRADEMQAVGGEAFIGQLMDAVPTAANIEHHARIVRDRFTLRRLLELSSETIRDVYDPGERSTQDIVDAAASRML